ncbi:MAG: SoxR reducing system RseC family protein [Clostridia bacterium]|nr:SoxR reducing system RseC family protein [Clostridia bacterium]
MEELLSAVGTVHEVNGEKATVVFKRSKACGDCHACTSFGDGNSVIELDNTLGAKVGDRVRIELHSGAVFKASLILYGIPLIALLLGVFIGSRIGDLAAALIGIGASAAALIGIKLIEPRIRKKSSFEPRMMELIDG